MYRNSCTTIGLNVQVCGATCIRTEMRSLLPSHIMDCVMLYLPCVLYQSLVCTISVPQWIIECVHTPDNECFTRSFLTFCTFKSLYFIITLRPDEIVELSLTTYWPRDDYPPIPRRIAGLGTYAQVSGYPSMSTQVRECRVVELPCCTLHVC